MKIKFIIITTILLTSCSHSGKEVYSSDKYSFTYPNTYTIFESNNTLTIQNENGRLELFNNKDFEIEPIHGYSSSGLEEFEKELVPKTKLKKENYSIWLFYEETDNKTKKELEEIYNSFTINTNQENGCLEEHIIFEDKELNYPNNFKNLNTVDATSIKEKSIVGYYTDLSFNTETEKEIVTQLLNSKYITTFWHLESTLCLKNESKSKETYKLDFDASHEYCTNECITDEYSFTINIDKTSGEISVEN